MNPQLSIEELGKYYPPDYQPHKIPIHEKALTYKKQKHEIRYVCDNLTDKSNLLDVGCGDGSFLNKVRGIIGCKVYGLDISKRATEAAKLSYNLDVYTGTIIDAPFPDYYFDVITAWQYLEHIPNPLEVSHKIFNLLKPGGICVVSTPNFNSFNAKIFKDRWYMLDCPRHLCIYAPHTILQLLRGARLKPIKISYDKSSKSLLASLQYVFYGNNYNAEFRNKIRRSSLLKMVCSPLTWMFALLRKSDSMVVVARKNSASETSDCK